MNLLILYFLLIYKDSLVIVIECNSCLFISLSYKSILLLFFKAVYTVVTIKEIEKLSIMCNLWWYMN